MYSIYHIPTFVHKDGSIGKIGCTAQKPKKRVEKQGYSSFEILETHDCIDSVSNRELELQKEHGYKVDKLPYKESVRRRPKWKKEQSDKGRETMRKNGFFKDWYKKGNEARIKGVVMLDKDTQEPIKEFDSISDAARYVNKPGNTSVIVSVCKGKRNSIYGYKWKYKD